MAKHGSSVAAQKIYRSSEKERARLRESDFKHVMTDPAGRRFMWYLLDDMCQLHGGSYTGDEQTFYNEGRRSVGIQLMQELQRLAPERYLEMVAEQVRGLRERKADEVAAESAQVTEAAETGEGELGDG